MRSRTGNIHVTRLAALLVSAVLLAVSCEGPSLEDNSPLELSIPMTKTSCEAGSQFIKVTAGGDWTIALAYSGGDDWAEVDVDEGHGTLAGITLKWGSNSSEDSRTVRIILKSGTRSTSADFVQGGYVQVNVGGGVLLPTELRSDPVPVLLELPEAPKDGLYYIKHDMEIGGRKIRNYSYCLDTEALLARWVAYPLNRSLISNGKRSDAWGLDPKVPRDKQPVLLGGFRTSTGGWGFDRGHQLPSADRYAPGANEQTFYGTNMTPQKNLLNAYAWATLEGMVRNWCYQCDTLYVVTGADINGSTEYAVDNDGKKVAVPKGYFKALVGYKKAQSQAYTGIAFYLDHKEYTSTSSAVMKCAMTIDQLEEKLGYDFFVNLPSVINYADKVESTVDKWWSDSL